jgi:hypothetical protein
VAGVAKWLRQWFVVPPFVGSSPIVRPRLTVLCGKAFTLERVVSQPEETLNIPSTATIAISIGKVNRGTYNTPIN